MVTFMAVVNWTVFVNCYESSIEYEDGTCGSWKLGRSEIDK
jgi:hypothetical protein